MASGDWGRVKETLLAQGLISLKDLKRALEVQRQRGGSLSKIFSEMKLVDPDALASALGRTLQIPVVHLSRIELDPRLAEKIPRRLAAHYQMVPVSLMGQQLTVAMSDPLNVLALDDLAQATGFLLSALITTPDEIQEALHRLYGGAIGDTLEQLGGQGAQRGTLELLTNQDEEKAGSLEEAIRLTQEGPIVKMTNAFLTEGVTLKASDILFEPLEKRLRIRYRVDGLFREGQSPPAGVHAGIVSRIKVMADLNIAEHRLPQDGRIRLGVGGRDVDFRVSVLPSYYGEKICLRILDKAQAMLDIDRLGFDAEALVSLKEAVGHPHGMVLITGPTGSGKTTTLYSLLKRVDRPDQNLVTIEDPVEFDLPGVNQVSIRPAIGLTFAAGLRSILRQDPDVILVGEIRDEETADIAVKAALTGHLVLSTLHTNDAMGSIARLVNMGAEPYLLASCLLLVGAQRLPRKVCSRCREAVRPSPEVMKRLGLPPEGKYARGKGCTVCRGTGLAGRVGLVEAVSVKGPLRRMVEEGASTVKLREEARKEGFLTLRDHAIAKAAAGMISLEEVARTTVGYQE